MKVRTLFAALAVAMLVSSGAAEARGITKKDKKVMRNAMQWIGGIANIIADGIDEPDPMISKLTKYVRKNKARIHAAGTKIDKIESELDAAAKSEWKQLVQSQPEMKKLMSSLMAFMQKHSSNKPLMDKIGKILAELDPKKGKK